MLVTDDEYRAAALAIRTWIEQQLTKPEVTAALAAAESAEGFTIGDHPLERIGILDILIRQGRAPGVTAERMPDFLTPPTWAVASSYRINYGCGAIALAFDGQPHGDLVPVSVSQDIELVLWPDLYDEPSQVGDHHSDGPNLTWNAADAENLASKTPSAVKRFAEALAAAADELADIEARSLTRFSAREVNQ
ncbi:hypothetical protein [Microbacterium paraoxydans]|uniref:hypothetical protein n=1 Tax=Microbacterium paraoxydans TaxID=199592 RepID=UPI001CFA4450|nr:hypothetical protein [Microbacterium paraoxydans]